VGAVLWLFVLKSGVHATVAGVVTAWALPMRTRGGAHLLEKVEHALHPWVAFGVLPVFAFVNAGVSLQGVTWQSLVEPIPLGIAVGLVVGKTIGVLAASWLAVVALGAAWPQGASRLQFFATCVMCGIGFTMSLFIGGLAFTGLSASYEVQLKLGVLAGSLVSALIGTLIFVVARRAPPQDN
jgi:NhaA family Na+:H+ antiporter